jgi:hypothetical protein
MSSGLVSFEWIAAIILERFSFDRLSTIFPDN